MVTNYTVHMITNSDWAALYYNPGKARRRWGMVSKVMEKTGAMVSSGTLVYKVVVHTVLLYGIES